MSDLESLGAPALYGRLAAWWPLMSAPADYAEEAALYRNVLVRSCDRPPARLLELGSGGGNNASHMRAHFTLTLVEPAPGMIAVSRALNPECEHAAGDMRTVRLNRVFDAVFVHDAVCYMTTEADLAAAMRTAFVHCAPGGAALFCPDYVRETFTPGTDHGGHDGPDRALRYLEWTSDPDPADTRYVVDYLFILRGPGDAVEVAHDRHVEGLFSRDTWLRLLHDAGFEGRSEVLHHSDVRQGMEVFVGRRPA